MTNSSQWVNRTRLNSKRKEREEDETVHDGEEGTGEPPAKH
jgi:hypothetical protein